ncbi:MAG: hypothetical protein RIR33_3207 [Pseudomonadota bacterium]|jgi:hypothetical protein
MRIEESFRATVWTQASTGAWHFVTLPADLSQRIRTLTTGLREPFGSFRVQAFTGRTDWETSLFADNRRGAFLLPVKAEVRRRERITVGDTIEIRLTLGF